MIERQVIEGRKASVVYIRHDFTPCKPAEADLVKVVFDDGEVAFLQAKPKKAA